MPTLHSVLVAVLLAVIVAVMTLAMVAVMAVTMAAIMVAVMTKGLASLAPLPCLLFAPMLAVHPMLPRFGMVAPMLFALVLIENQAAIIALAFQADNGFAMAILMAIHMAILGLARRGGENHYGGGQCGEYLLFHDVYLSFAQFIMQTFCSMRPEPKLRAEFILGSSLRPPGLSGYCPNINH